MFAPISPAYFPGILFFLTTAGYVYISAVTLKSDPSSKIRQEFIMATFFVALSSLFFGLMTISADQNSARVFWSLGISSVLMFLPFWLRFVSNMFTFNSDFVRRAVRRVPVFAALFVIWLCIYFGEVEFYLTRFGQRISYKDDLKFIALTISLVLFFIAVTACHIRWLREAQMKRIKTQQKMFVVLAVLCAPLAIFVDFFVPAVLEHPAPTIAPIVLFIPAMQLFLSMRKNRTLSLTLSNVAEYVFESVTVPSAVLDHNNDVAIANNAALNFFGKDFPGGNICDFILIDDKTPEQALFADDFETDRVTAKTVSGLKECSFMHVLERDEYGDALCKIVVARDISDIFYRNTLLQSVNHAAELLLKSNINTYEKNLLKSVELLAEVAVVHCVHIWKNKYDVENRQCNQIIKWSKYSTSLQAGRLFVNIPYREIAPDWEDVLAANKNINRTVESGHGWEENAYIPPDTKSMLIVPIFIQEQFWGFAGFYDCQRSDPYTEQEATILKSGALLFANAWRLFEMERNVFEATNYTKLMLDSSPLGCQIWNSKAELIDCNDAGAALFGFKDKNEYLERYLETFPELQPDGQRSDEQLIALSARTQREGHVVLNWMHRMPSDGSLVPTEVTLVNVVHKGENLVFAYTRDLRDIKTMEHEIARLEKEADKIYYDGLTGIYNRRYFDENLAHVMRILSRSGGVLSLLLLDIDFFKKYNDTYGHGEGDNCLKAVAEVLSGCIERSEDFVARYGGEEFAVVLPNTHEAGAKKFAEKLIDSLYVRNIPHVSSEVSNRLSFSIGIVTGIPFHEQNAPDFIKLADEMLYESKRAGRNRYNVTNFSHAAIR